MKQTTKVLLSAVLTIALCLSVISGATFALFTSEASTNIAVTAGTVKVDAEILTNTLKLFSMTDDEQTAVDANGNKLFATGGTASFDDAGNLKLDRVVPGDKVTFDIKVSNTSNVTVAFRTIVDTIADDGLFNGLKVTVGNNTPYTGFTATAWTTETAAFERIVPVTIELPTEAGNEYQGKSCTLSYKVEAIQGNGVDYAYLEQEANGTYLIKNATDLKILSMLVNSGRLGATQIATLSTENVVMNTTPVVKLTANINALGNFTPIGNSTNSFVGIFDGQGYTISGMKVYNNNGAGLFGYAGVGTTIKNVNIKDATIVTNHYAGGIAGYLYGDIIGCSVTGDTYITVMPEVKADGTYDNGDKAGGIVGYFANGKLVNNTVDGVSMVAYRDIGGIAGHISNDGTTVPPEVSANTVSNAKIDTNDFGMDYGKAMLVGAVFARKTGTINFDESKNGVENVTINGEIVSNDTKIVDNADELIEGLENGKDVIFTEDVDINPAGMSSGYGKTGINVKNGQTVDGGGNVLDIQGAGGTWDSGINTTGGVIKNITVTGSFRGVFINKNSEHNERVILENVIIDGTTYTISCDSGNGKGLTATNSTFNGWTSYAATLGDAEFINCSFGEGRGYAFMRPYAPTVFINCDFEEGFQMDPRAKVTFINCRLGDESITEENFETLVTYNSQNAKVLVETESSDDLSNMIDNNEEIIYLASGNNYTIPSNLGDVSTIYANGATLTFESSILSDVTVNDAVIDSEIKMGGSVSATFKNCDFTGDYGFNYTYGKDIVLDGCTFDCAEKAIHFDVVGSSLVVKNCEFIRGRVQIGTSTDTVASFENCTFGGTTQTSIWSEKGIRVYPKTTFTNCEFNNRVVLAGSNGLELTFVDCTMNGGEAVTSDVIKGGNVPSVTIK